MIMTQNKAKKTAARQRMAETGEPYSVARRAVQAGQPGSGEAGQIVVRYRLARTFELEVDEEAWAKADNQTRARLIAEGSGQDSSHPRTTLSELIAHDLDERGTGAFAAAADQRWEEEYYADGAASEGISVEEFKARVASGQAQGWAQERADEARERAQERDDEARERAQERADRAQERADLAQEQAEEARSRAEEAQDLADEARDLADEARELADEAREDGDRAAWERADRDAERAQEQANRAQARADREQERAERERERAEHEQERADLEQERAGAGPDYAYHQPPSGMPRPPRPPHPPRPPRPPRLPRLPRLPR
jgi:hypothetical protein